MPTGNTRFDQMFDSMMTEHAIEDAVKSHFQTAIPTPIPPNPEAPFEEDIRHAVALFHSGHYARCLTQVRKLELEAGTEPRVAALLCASKALVEGRLGPGIQRCTELIEQTFYVPDLYYALGVLLVKSRRRAEAYQVIQRGLRIDPQHQALQTQLSNLGIRRQPVFRFLDRSHPANRWLGLLRARFSPT